MISNRAIERLKSGKLSEAITTGLSIEVAGQRKVWRYRRRISNTNQTINLTLGAYPAFDMEAARNWAQSLNFLVEAGRDPRAPVVTTKDEITVREAHELYLVDCRSGDRRTLKARTLRDKEQRGRLDILPEIGDMVLSTVTADQLWRIVENKGLTAKVRANRLATEIKVFFKWCQSRAAAQHGIRLLHDPAATLSGKYYRESLGRTRILSDDEIGWFVRAVMQQRNPAICRLYMLLLLTGVRLNEAAEAPASEYAHGVWTINGERTKNRQSLSVTLGSWLAAQLSISGGPWLVGQRFNESSLYSARDRIHSSMERMAGHGIEHWTHHDLRRTLRSNTFALEIGFEVAEAMLNHTRKGLERRYDQSDLSAHMARGWALWEQKVLTLAVGRCG